MLDGVWLKLHLMPELSCFTHLRVDWKLQCCQSLFIGHPPSTKGIVATRALSNEVKSEKCMGENALLLSCTIPSISQHDVCWLQDCQLLWVFIVINLNQIWLLFQRIDTSCHDICFLLTFSRSHVHSTWWCFESWNLARGPAPRESVTK